MMLRPEKQADPPASAENSMRTTGEEALQVVRPPTPEQVQNCCIINTIWRFYWKCDLHFNDLKRGHLHTASGPTEMSEALSILASSSSNWLPAVMAALEEMMELVNIAITPLLSEIAKNIEAIILNMHDVHSSLTANEGAPCPWSEELRSFVSRVVKDHFTTLVCKQAIMERLRGLSRRAVVQATTNVFLVKASGQGTSAAGESLLRSNLIKGLNELEQAL